MTDNPNREISDVIRISSNALNSKKKLIDGIVEEVSKNIPTCNFNIIEHLFEGDNKNSIRFVWVNPNTGEFYTRPDFKRSYLRISVHKEWNKLMMNQNCRLDQFAYEHSSSYFAYVNLYNTGQLIKDFN